MNKGVFVSSDNNINMTIVTVIITMVAKAVYNCNKNYKNDRI